MQPHRSFLPSCLLLAFLVTASGCPDSPEGDDVTTSASCTDGAIDGDETGVDCGGSCELACPPTGPCDSDERCGPGYLCESDYAGFDWDNPQSFRLGACVRQVDSCIDVPCGEGGWCTFGTDSADHEVAFCLPRHSRGAACMTGADQDENTCLDGLHCEPDAETSINGHCVDGPPPGYPEGHACDASGECGAGVYCGAAGRCVPREPVGSDCADQFECIAGTTCALPEGLVCHDWVDCADGEECCATADGAECRASGTGSCELPHGTCQVALHYF